MWDDTLSTLMAITSPPYIFRTMHVQWIRSLGHPHITTLFGRRESWQFWIRMRNKGLDQGDSWEPEKLKRALIPTKLPTEDRKVRPAHSARIPHRKSQPLLPRNVEYTGRFASRVPEAGCTYQPVGASVHMKDKRQPWVLMWNLRVLAVLVSTTRDL